jgi:hypothetical protein
VIIDLRPAYERIAALLDARGLTRTSYKLGLDVWNHREMAARAPDFKFSIFAHTGGDHVYASGATLEDVLAEFERALDAWRPPTPPAAPAHEPGDLRVAVPFEATHQE